ncbi:MAG: hypothetical protein ACRYGB_08205 [Janthinobacterium lividum]
MQILVGTADRNRRKQKGDFAAKELLEIKKLIVKNQQLLEKQLDLFYSKQTVKAIKK